MDKEKAIFISDSKFINNNAPEGGVSLCTREFISLLNIKFDLILFPIKIRRTLLYRLLVKFSLNTYDDFRPTAYISQLKNLVEQHQIKYIFLNLSNTIRFSKIIKKIQKDIKVVICSHGNESGDTIHELAMHKDSLSFFRRFFGNWRLGKMLVLESVYRHKYVDMVLTVSEVELNIEKWLGTKNSFLVYRTIANDLLNLHPVLNRVGFMGDLSHAPNYSGIISFCNALSRQSHSIELHLAGGPENIGKEIGIKYPFVKYSGFLSENDLKMEASTWSYFINPVFYYSRGVSTKLAKALSWGLPVISTIPGNRGYSWKKGTLAIAKNAEEMVQITIKRAGNLQLIQIDQQETKEIVNSCLTLEEIMNGLYPRLLQI